MLLIILCQKIVASYNSIVVILTKQFMRMHRPNQGNDIQIPNIENVMATAREVDHSLVRDYEVEVEEEPCVFGGLVQMQIKKMTMFLGSLKATMNDQGWRSHATMIEWLKMM